MSTMPTMPTMPTLPTFDLPALPFDLPSVDLSAFQLQELPTLSWPELSELPGVQQLLDIARDGAYIGVGLAVMTAERTQALGTKVVELVSAGVEQARAAATN